MYEWYIVGLLNDIVYLFAFVFTSDIRHGLMIGSLCLLMSATAVLSFHFVMILCVPYTFGWCIL